MADTYASASATGGGAGTKADPFTIVEQSQDTTVLGADDTGWIEKGSYVLTAPLLYALLSRSYAGYDTVEGDLDNVWDEGNKPVLSKTGSVANLIGDNNKRNIFRNLVGDGADAVNFNMDALSSVHNMVSKNAGTDGFGGASASFCIARDCGAEGFGAANASYCLAEGNTSHGFENNVGSYDGCVAYNNGGDGIRGKFVVGCTTISNTGDGINSSSAVSDYFANNIMANNGGYGFRGSSTYRGVIVRNCNFYNNTLGANLYGDIINANTDNPQITDPANGDFSIGNADIYGIGAYMGSLDGTGTLDLGAIQKSAGTGGGDAPTFAGIDSLTDNGDGSVTAAWLAATGDKTGYNVYVKLDNDTNLFTDTNFKCTVDDTDTSIKFCTLADNSTALQAGDDVYVGIRAQNNGTEDTNTASENVTVTTGVAPTFAGITGLENVGFGALLVSWSAGSGTIGTYNIYARSGSAPTMADDTYLVAKVKNTATSVKIAHFTDGTRFTDSDNIYVGVQAENSGSLDGNSVTLNEYPQGSGSVGVKIYDGIAVGLTGK